MIKNIVNHTMLLLFPEELLSHIIKELDVISLLNFVCSNKILFLNKNIYISGNIKILKYKEYDESDTGYLKILKDSDINICIGKRSSLLYFKFNIYDKLKIHNTTKILSYECDYTNMLQSQRALSYYYSKHIQNYYNYDINASKWCIKKFQHIFYFEWSKMAVNLYDIYELLFHLYYKKYGRIKKVLNNLKFIKNNNIKETLNILINFSNFFQYSLLDSQSKAVIIYIIYSYIDFIGHDIQKIKDFSKLCQTMITKSEEFTLEIINLKYMPMYLKMIINNKIKNASNKILLRL